MVFDCSRADEQALPNFGVCEAVAGESGNLCSPGEPPGRLFRSWLEGAYELVVSPLLLDELERALGYSKLRDRVMTAETRELLEVLARAGVVVGDPHTPPEVRSPDPDDDYLIAVASISRSVLVSGDADLLGLSDRIPVYSPTEFLALIEKGNSDSS